MNFFLKHTVRDVLLTEKVDEKYRNTNICRFRGNGITSNKIRDHCQLTGKYRGAAYEKYNIKVTQKQNNFIPFVFHMFSDYYCHLLFKKLFDRKKN